MDTFDQVYEYQAGGKTVFLRPDKKLVGVNLSGLDKAMLKSLQDAAMGDLQEIKRGMALIPRSLLQGKLIGELREKNVLFPVFSDGGTRVIALPEVRIEPPVGKVVKAGFRNLNRWIGEHEPEVQVLANTPDRVVLSPLSGYGPDAVTLARDIAKKFKPLTASPRFLRIIPRPRLA